MTEPLYRIGEAARLLELETYVLRFWETEFTQLEPLRTPKGQRLYTANHLDLLKRVKALLYDDGLTIEGARKALARQTGTAGVEPASADPQLPKVVRPAKPARFVQGTLLPRPAPVVRDTASIQLLQDLRCELGSLQALVQAGDFSTTSPPTADPSEEPPA